MYCNILISLYYKVTKEAGKIENDQKSKPKRTETNRNRLSGYEKEEREENNTDKRKNKEESREDQKNDVINLGLSQKLSQKVVSERFPLKRFIEVRERDFSLLLC